jgi:hypothetical protein
VTTYAYPTAANFLPSRQSLLIKVNQQMSSSPLSGDVQVLTRPGSRWGWDVQLPQQLPSELAAVEAFLARLNGREHLITIHDHFRPVPRGTCNLTGVTTSGTISQFATTATLQGCGATRTLLAGDWIKIASQLVMIVADATANGSGVMSIEFRHAMRASVSSGAAVVLDRPTSTYMMASSDLEILREATYSQEGPTFQLVEDFS